LENQVKALTAERDRLIVRRQSLIAEQRELWEWQLAIRDSDRRSMLIASAIRRDADILRSDSGLCHEAMLGNAVVER
jgi:hypothetical protein